MPSFCIYICQRNRAAHLDCPTLVFGHVSVEPFLSSRPFPYSMDHNLPEGDDSSLSDSGEPTCHLLHVELPAHSILK